MKPLVITDSLDTRVEKYSEVHVSFVLQARDAACTHYMDQITDLARYANTKEPLGLVVTKFDIRKQDA